MYSRDLFKFQARVSGKDDSFLRKTKKQNESVGDSYSDPVNFGVASKCKVVIKPISLIVYLIYLVLFLWSNYFTQCSLDLFNLVHDPAHIYVQYYEGFYRNCVVNPWKLFSIMSKPPSPQC